MVFDFEDGLQGWTPSGAAERTNTSILGGEWSILGDGVASGHTGSASIHAVIDLTNVSAVSVEQFFLGETATTSDFLTIRITPDNAHGTITAYDPWGAYRQLFSGDSESDPSTRTIVFDPMFAGPLTVQIIWGWFCLFCDPLTYAAELTGYLDNVTLHLVPEPSLMLLGSAAVVALVFRRGAGGERPRRS